MKDERQIKDSVLVLEVDPQSKPKLCVALLVHSDLILLLKDTRFCEQLRVGLCVR